MLFKTFGVRNDILKERDEINEIINRIDTVATMSEAQLNQFITNHFSKVGNASVLEGLTVVCEITRANSIAIKKMKDLFKDAK